MPAKTKGKVLSMYINKQYIFTIYRVIVQFLLFGKMKYIWQNEKYQFK